MKKQETIVGVAVIHDGKTYTLPKPNRHHHVLKQIYDLHGVPADGTQGFYTDEGRFLNRQQAYDLARNNGQLKERKIFESRLYSEDLW
jgi:hypothetical protein